MCQPYQPALDRPLVLFFIPDGHVKATPGTAAISADEVYYVRV